MTCGCARNCLFAAVWAVAETRLSGAKLHDSDHKKAVEFRDCVVRNYLFIRIKRPSHQCNVSHVEATRSCVFPGAVNVELPAY